jgi:thioredoxin-related protein
MSQRSFALIMLLVVLLTFGGLILYDLKTRHHIGEKPSSNWQWSDQWDDQSPVTPEVPVDPPQEAPPVEEPQERPREQIVASDYADAIAKSGQYEIPVFVYFEADWCSFCKKMKQETLSNAQVKEIMKNYIVVYVNTDQNKQIAQKYGVRILPTFVITNQTEAKLKAGQGYQDVATFSAWLNDPRLLEQPKGEVQPENRGVIPKVMPRQRIPQGGG